MKKILCLILVCMCLAGCSKTNSVEPKDEVTYSYEEADAVITDIDTKQWFATVHRYSWYIAVEYDGMTYSEDDYANGQMNKPYFFDSKVGDYVVVEVTNEYVNGKLVDRYIFGIR